MTRRVAVNYFLQMFEAYPGCNCDCRPTKCPEVGEQTLWTLSQYVLEALRTDEEFVLYRGAHSNHFGLPSVLLLAPVSMRPALETVKKIEHEYSLRDELDSAWVVRPLALSEHLGRTTLVLEDPGGETLDRLLPGPMEIPQFLRLAVGLATALGGLHKRDLIHKDVRPTIVLANSATGQVRLLGSDGFARDRLLIPEKLYESL